MMVVARDPTASPDPTEKERRFLDEFAYWLREETGYQWIQGTRPQTLAFGLTDSPAGLAVWMVEKFRAWSDWGDDIQQTIRDRMLANIALYWFTGAIGSSFWTHYARLHEAPFVPTGETISVPTGYAEVPREIVKPPRSAASRVFADLRRWTIMPRGGRFAALEQPDLLANDVRAFFRELR
jgi:microsomal epoxide hydrolase